MSRINENALRAAAAGRRIRHLRPTVLPPRRFGCSPPVSLAAAPTRSPPLPHGRGAVRMAGGDSPTPGTFALAPQATKCFSARCYRRMCGMRYTWSGGCARFCSDRPKIQRLRCTSRPWDYRYMVGRFYAWRGAGFPDFGTRLTFRTPLPSATNGPRTRISEGAKYFAT